MKVTRERTQFDHPLSVGTPATPSCCCCCCCCLATVVSTVSIGAITAQHEAKRFDRRSGWPILLAILAVPIGFFATGVVGSASGEGVVAVIGGAMAALTLWYFAFHLAAPESETSAVGRSFKYLVLFAVFFAVELFIGFFLVILYVVPYLIVAALVAFFVIRAHLRSQRESLPTSMPPPPTWRPLPPPPPGTPASRPTTMLSADQPDNPLGLGGDTSSAPAAWPPRSDYQSSSALPSPTGAGPTVPLPPTSDVGGYEPPVPSGTPSFQPPPPAPTANPGFEPPSFEPPDEYQLPGYPAAPPRAPDTGQPPPTYRPGNPSTHPPTDEQA